jgi:multiple sugar transport system substrate-binding protein
MRVRNASQGILLFAAILFSSCPVFGSAASEEEQGDTVATVEVPPSPDRKVLTILTVGTLYRFSCELLQERISNKRDVELTYMSVSGNDLIEKVKEAFAGGEIDLLLIPPFWVPELAETGLLLPLGDQEWELDPLLDDIIVPFLEFYCYYDGTLYALPFDGDVRLFYYRRDLIESPHERERFKKEYGYDLSVPQSYEEAFDFARFFTRKKGESLAGTPLGHDFFGTGMSLGPGWCHYEWIDRFLSYKGVYFDAVLRPGIAGEAGVRALENVRELLRFAPPGVLYWGYGENRDAFLTGKLASVVLWSDFFKFVHDSSRSKVKDKVGVSHIPGVRSDGELLFRAPMPGGCVGAVSSSTNEVEACLWVLSFMSEVTSSELTLDPRTRCDPFRYSHTRSAATLSENLSGLSGSLVPIEECQRYLEAVRVSIENGAPDINIPFSREYVDLLDLYLHRTLRGELEPKEALLGTAKEWENISERVGYDKQRNIWTALYRIWQEQGYAE